MKFILFAAGCPDDGLAQKVHSGVACAGRSSVLVLANSCWIHVGMLGDLVSAGQIFRPPGA